MMPFDDDLSMDGAELANLLMRPAGDGVAPPDGQEPPADDEDSTTLPTGDAPVDPDAPTDFSALQMELR